MAFWEEIFEKETPDLFWAGMGQATMVLFQKRNFGRLYHHVEREPPNFSFWVRHEKVFSLSF